MTPRLRFLLSQAIPQRPLWDIGCDHGYLAQSALFSGLHPAVHFVDPLNHQIENARSRIQGFARFEGQAFFHALKGDDLTLPLNGNIVIAGMGGNTMITMVRRWIQAGLWQADRLILSPHKDVPQLLQDLALLPELRLVQETSILERGRTRPVLVYDSN